MLTRLPTGMPIADAHDDYARAYLVSRLVRRRSRPRTLCDAAVVRRRWERVALAHRTGVGLPPIRVRKGDDGYYLIDGRHRVSVARALGHRDIDAWVA